MQKINTAHGSMAMFNGNIDVSYLDKQLLDDKGRLTVQSSYFYSQVPHEHLIVWCHKNGIYGLPTDELIDWLSKKIDVNSTIEIGAGNGLIGRTLGIPITDSRMHERPEVALMYQMGGQPVTKYPDDVEGLDAVSAIKKYKPKTVIGCWVTHLYHEDEHDRGGNMFGIDEDFIVDNVEQYIVIGNSTVHCKKRILVRDHEELSYPWIFSRSVNPDKNVIYVWKNT